MKAVADASSRKRIWELMTWIRDHLDEPLTVTSLAERAGMSVRHFYRLFEQVSGEPPSEHVQRLRLARGAAWLAYTDAPVIEAALIAGYESREAFTRLFSKHFNCSPKAYRSRLHQQIRALARRPVPQGLRIVGMESFPPLTFVVWPHMGPYLDSLKAWLALGAWAKAHEQLGPYARPVSVIYDDVGLISTLANERYDAALAFDSVLDIPGDDSEYICYQLPGGPFIIAEYTGSLAGLDAAWDYFGLVWFIGSGFQLRDSRVLVLFDPADIPTSPLHIARLLARKRIRCRLCIPTDSVAGDGLPVLNGHGWQK